MSTESAANVECGGPHDAEFLADYAALTEAAGVVDLSDRAEVELVGKDAHKLLQNLTTNDLRKLGAGQGCEDFALDAKGKIVGHMFVYLGDNMATLESAPGQGSRLVAHFDRYILREDVQPTDRTAERTKLLVAGPQAMEILAQVVEAPLPVASYDHRPADASGMVWVRKTRWPSGGGYLLVCPREQGGVWLDKLRAAGARACGRPSWETVRVEAGLPVFGIDVTDENLAQEVDRNNSAISLTKGCYLGQETVARIDALGHVNKLLRGVRFAGETPPPAGTELRRGEKVVGRVSSAVWSPNFGVVALAFVRREAAAAGTELESASGPATVAALPFVE